MDSDLISHGRPFEYPAEIVERALWAMALEGGSATRAFRRLEAEYPDVTPPPPRTMRNWRRRFDIRYQEVTVTRAKDLEELVASQNVSFALRAADVQEEALRRVQAGLGTTNAVEASQVLRNVAQSAQSGVQISAQLRGRAAFMPADARAVDQLAEALTRLGAAIIVEGSGVEIFDAELAPESAQSPPSALAPGEPAP